MKFIKITLVSILTVISACGQNSPSIPTPPKTPNSTNSHTEVTTSSSSRISSSTSVSDSNSQFKFKSKFHASKREGVENILSDALEDIKVIKNRREKVWEIEKNGEVVFECSLSKSRMSIYLDKSEASTRLYRKIKAVAEDLQEYISSHKRHTYQNKRRNSVSSAEVRLERAKRELEASIQNLKEVKRESEKMNSNGY